MTNRTIWIVVGLFAAILFTAGVVHLAWRTSAQLYLNMRETDEKQTQYIFQLEKRMDEVERKQAVFEQSLKYEAERVGKAK